MHSRQTSHWFPNDVLGRKRNCTSLLSAITFFFFIYVLVGGKYIHDICNSNFSLLTMLDCLLFHQCSSLTFNPNTRILKKSLPYREFFTGLISGDELRYELFPAAFSLPSGERNCMSLQFENVLSQFSPYDLTVNEIFPP